MLHLTLFLLLIAISAVFFAWVAVNEFKPKGGFERKGLFAMADDETFEQRYGDKTPL